MVLLILMLYLSGAIFKQTAYFPHGAGWQSPTHYDANHNGIPELYIVSPPDTGTMVYEHIGNNQFNETRLFNVSVIGIGNGDNDSLTDAYGQSAPYGQAIGIWESRSLNSYPDSLVWNYPMPDTEQAYAINQGIFIDFDQDGKMNLITPIWPVDLLYFENTQDNYYTLIDSLCLPPGGGPAEMVVADFDYDSLLEMVGGGAGDYAGIVYVWENTAIGVDSFHLIWTYQFPAYSGNAYRIAMGNDMDQDGRLEFCVQSNQSADWYFAIFETNGNNSYHKTWEKAYHYPPGMMTDGDIACGDVDGDGIDELVFVSHLELYVWKCVGPDSFVQIWEKRYYQDLTDALLLICDLNQNGLEEIIVSGANEGAYPPGETYIYEKQPSVTWIYPARYDTLWANDTVNLRWKLDETTSLASLRLYIAHPLMGSWLVYQGLPQDTTCTFVVPDTQSNMAFKFWVAVNGYLRYDSIVSPPFYIKRRTGIEEAGAGKQRKRIGLWVYPNPFTTRLNIRYRMTDMESEIPNVHISDTAHPLAVGLKIYDASGRLIRQWNYETMRQGDQIVWSGDDDLGRKLPPGVYFVLLEANDCKLLEKVILLW